MTIPKGHQKLHRTWKLLALRNRRGKLANSSPIGFRSGRVVRAHASFSLQPALARAINSRGFQELTPVQSAVIANEAHGRDLIVSAKTGSGKTVAFGLAIAPELLDRGIHAPARAPLALVITPTRELAIQVSKELQWLYANAGARVVTCVGGMDPMKEQAGASWRRAYCCWNARSSSRPS